MWAKSAKKAADEKTDRGIQETKKLLESGGTYEYKEDPKPNSHFDPSTNQELVPAHNGPH